MTLFSVEIINIPSYNYFYILPWNPGTLALWYKFMKCPRCKKTLIVVEREKIELDYCMSCKGFWFDQDEWNFLPEALNLDIKFPDFTTYPRFKIKEIDTKCPNCTKKMEQIYLGKNENSEAQDIASVILDICPQGHGIWFDPNELGKVLSGLVIKSGSEAEKKVINFLGEFIKHN